MIRVILVMAIPNKSNNSKIMIIVILVRAIGGGSMPFFHFLALR